MANEQRNTGEISSEELGLVLAQKVNEVNAIQIELQTRLQRYTNVEKEVASDE